MKTGVLGLKSSDGLADSLVPDADSLQESVDDIKESSSHLQLSFYALLAWTLLVTVVLVIVSVLTYRRWKSRKFSADLESSDRSSVYGYDSGSLASGNSTFS